MKTQFVSLALLALVFTGCNKDDDDTGSGNGNGAPAATYEVGDEGPGGGHIFYVDTENEFEWTYLEAAPSDWSDSGEDPNLQFAWGQGVYPGPSTNFNLGAGFGNNTTIEQGSWNFPGVISSMEYSVETDGVVYDDWFLPSVMELMLMYDELHVNGIGGFRTETNAGQFSSRVLYQSSTVQNGNNWYVNFEIPADGEERDGDMFGLSVADSQRGYVRPIRRF